MRNGIKHSISALALVGISSIMMACGANPQTREASGNTSVDNGNGNAANQRKAGVNPCTLLTKEDAEAALGAPVKKVTPQGLSTAEACQYLRAKADTLAQAGESVTLQVHYGGGKLFDSYVKEAEQTFDSKGQQVEGVGDKAVYNSDQFIVLNKNDFFIITMGKRMPDAEKLAAIKGLAQKIVVRL